MISNATEIVHSRERNNVYIFCKMYPVIKISRADGVLKGCVYRISQFLIQHILYHKLHSQE
jgi:hypothetical protein